MDELSGDQVVKDALGPIYDEFMRVKSGEWSSYHATDHPVGDRQISDDVLVPCPS